MAARKAARMTARKAMLADIAEIALSLPEVEEGTSWGNSAYVVRKKSFLHFREPRPDAVDPETGERMQDVIMFAVGDQDDKEALLGSGGPWFTTPHFDGYNAVLLRQRDVGRLTRAELAEVITDAWAAKAPKKLVAEHFGRS
jgi:hypothetical protein